MKRLSSTVVVLFAALLAQCTAAEKKSAVADTKQDHHEYKTLRELLGTPKENPVAAKAVPGIKTTTRLHKICSWKKQMKNKPDEWAEDKTVYDKLMCGMYTMKDEYQKHERNAASIIAGKHKDKSLDEQKKFLFEAVHEMAKAAGPLPRLNLRVIGK